MGPHRSSLLPLPVGALLGACACANPGATPPKPVWPSPISGAELGAHVGDLVCIVGKEAVEVWQHLVGGVAGKTPVYFDPKDGAQIVAHVAEPIACPGEVELFGRVREERGSSKRPGKVDESYVEYSLDVEAWRCRVKS